jgi:hypothetical protein
MATLVDTTGQRYGISADKLTTVGRGPDNDIILNNGSVSHHHATLLSTKGRYYIHDLGSTNGTFVSGQRVIDAELAAGTRIGLGDLDLTFETVSHPSKNVSIPANRPLKPITAIACAECGHETLNQSTHNCTECGAALVAMSTRSGSYFTRKTCPNCQQYNFRRGAQFCEKCECKLNGMTDFVTAVFALTLLGLGVFGLIELISRC